MKNIGNTWNKLTRYTTNCPATCRANSWEIGGLCRHYCYYYFCYNHCTEAVDTTFKNVVNIETQRHKFAFEINLFIRINWLNVCYYLSYSLYLLSVKWTSNLYSVKCGFYVWVRVYISRMSAKLAMTVWGSVCQKELHKLWADISVRDLTF